MRGAGIFDHAIENSHFYDDAIGRKTREGTTGEAMLDVELIQPEGSVFVDANRGLDAGRLEHADARSPHPHVRISHRDDGATHTGLDHRLRAGWTSMLVRAGLEVDVDRAPEGALASGGERLFLSVRCARPSVVALARDRSFRIDYDRANHRVRAGSVVGARRQLDGPRGPHEVQARIERICCQALGNIRCLRRRTGAQGMIDNRIRSMRFSSCFQLWIT